MNAPEQIPPTEEQLEAGAAFLVRIKQNIGRLIVGQESLLERLCYALLCDGHVLLEGMPGLAKTLTISALARSMQASFSRIQFTPDLLPSDVTGTMVYHQHSGQFSLRKGPVFAHILLADEINRAPAKVQSALLQAMQERQVTIGIETHTLPDPFFVLATQNPVEQEGTYALPEAQLDRFLFKILVLPPGPEEERQIVRQQIAPVPVDIQPVATIDELLMARTLLRQVFVDDKIIQYIVSLVQHTRTKTGIDGGRFARYISYGASVRASIGMAMAARAVALSARRGYVLPADVQTVAPDILRHRIGLSYDAVADQVEADTIIQALLRSVPLP